MKIGLNSWPVQVSVKWATVALIGLALVGIVRAWLRIQDRDFSAPFWLIVIANIIVPAHVEIGRCVTWALPNHQFASKNKTKN